MKVIDLLNKIANGEEVPKKIKYNNDIYMHIDNYCYYCDETNLILSDRIFAEYSRLNDEVEIIEDKPFSEKVEKIYNEHIDYIYSKSEEDKKIEKVDVNHLQTVKKWKRAKILGNKINEIIDYLEEKEWN